MRFIAYHATATLLLLLLSSTSNARAQMVVVPPAPGVDATLASTERPARWAQPVEAEGVPNLYQVTKTLYRSAQPTADGMVNLKEMGIETIVNLRSFHSDRSEIGDTGLDYEHIYMKAWNPEGEELVRFLKIVTNEDRTPVLVHCQHGSDRTGLVCATYRIVVQGWTKEEAIEEMTKGGFGFHTLWINLVDEIREMDVDRLRKEAGLVPTPTP